MRILIVGLGYVGSRLAQLLYAEGHNVVGIRRTPKKPGESLVGRLIVGDIHSAETLEQIPADLDAVVYALSPGERSARAYQKAFPIGLARIIEATGGSRFLFVSSTSVYAQTGGELVREQSSAHADTETAQALLEAEGLLLGRSRQDIVLRASGIYGPGRTRLISQLFHHDLSETERTTWTNRIHRDDLARIILFLLNRPLEEGSFLASDAAASTLGEMQEWLRMQDAGHLLTRGDKSRAMTRKNRRVRAERLESLGFRYTYPSFREGYTAILDQLREDS
jgi:nucleoside-diphosphate-sugar epimerase